MSDNELPEGWANARLQDVAQWGSGGTPSRSNKSYFGGTIPWIKTGELGPLYVSTTEETITAEGLKNSSAKLFPGGSVAIAMYGATIGKTSILGIDATTNQACAVGIPNYQVTTSKFLYYYLLSQREAFIAAGKGGAQPNISQAMIKSWPVQLPPLNEQKRIADKLDSLFDRIGACRTRLERVPHLVKRFRQSLLCAAITGKLSEDWRLAHKHVRQSLDEINNPELPLLPESWSWVQNKLLAAESSNAICAGPFGTIFKAKDFRQRGVPIVFLRHVGEGRYLTHKPNYMDESVWKALHQEYSIYGGELLVTKLGDPPGTACIYPEGVGTAMVTPDVIKMSVNNAVADTAYLMHFFNSSIAKDIVRQLAFGVTRLRIDLKMFRTFPIPLPPLEEQSEIVRRVTLLLALADQAEKQVKTAVQYCEELRTSSLTSAFLGELVPQDPTDEPVAELLARILQGPENERRANLPKAKSRKKEIALAK